MPLAILCAERLHNTGTDVVLATSDHPTDDALSAIAERAGVKVFRGSLTDVLARFAACTADLDGEDIVVRMTADNPVPDGDFVGRLVDAFVEQQPTYLGTRWPEDGLPYGLGGEVFTAGRLRRAAASAHTPSQREHVTTFLVEKDSGRRIGTHGALAEGDWSHLRCTIDTLADYVAMARVFDSVGDPIKASWRSFLPSLPRGAPTGGRRVPCVVKNGESYSRLALGTAQVGMQYGIANRTGSPSDEELRAMLVAAVSAGVTHLDTAREYGNAETRIGEVLDAERLGSTRVITKLAALPAYGPRTKRSEIARAVDASVFRSCHALRRRRIDVVMFHRYTDMVRWKGAALDRLAELAEEGVIGALGVSVYTPAEAIESLGDERIQQVQIPFNLLDSRWLGDEFQSSLAARPDVTIHARSVFLQGLLINSPEVWPKWFRRRNGFVASILKLCVDLGRQSPADLCMAYVSAHPWVTTMVLGAERLDQLEELLGLASARPLTPAEVEHVMATFDDVPARLVNPAKWS